MPDASPQSQFELVAEAIHWLIEHRQEQPSLRQLAERFGYSEAHLQKMFKGHVGVSPKQFLKYLTKQEALERLRRGESVLQTALECGLSGPGRLHDLLVTTEAMTPGEVRRRAANVPMEYGSGITPLGTALAAWTQRGVSFLAFTHDHGETQALAQLQRQWPDAQLRPEPAQAQTLLNRIFLEPGPAPLSVWLRGSPFQLRVWQALLEIQPGTHWSYGEVARFVGRPGAGRAVGAAIGRNPVAWLIPCHRVINRSGSMGGYRWGEASKLALIGMEAGSGRAPGIGASFTPGR